MSASVHCVVCLEILATRSGRWYTGGKTFRVCQAHIYIGSLVLPLLLSLEILPANAASYMIAHPKIYHISTSVSFDVCRQACKGRKATDCAQAYLYTEAASCRSLDARSSRPKPQHPGSHGSYMPSSTLCLGSNSCDLTKTKNVNTHVEQRRTHKKLVRTLYVHAYPVAPNLPNSRPDWLHYDCRQ